MMLSTEEVFLFIRQHDYDIRKTGNARWIDQKCAADVVSAVSDCVFNYALNHREDAFTSVDVWHSPYTVDNVEAIFRKPRADEEKAQNEYDKFFQQPMEMLSYAGVLKKTKRRNRNFYQVENYEVLEYIALRERNAYCFLKAYIEKVLQDSGLWPFFEAFFAQQNKDSYDAVKKAFSDFIIRETHINGVVECNRIFIKVLNPLAYAKGKRGTKDGRISEHPITYDMLMYNRNNFRDVYANKPKGITRKEFAAAHPQDKGSEAYYRYQSARAKRFLRLFNDNYRGGISEHIEARHQEDPAVQIHHIFPESEFPEISAYLENLIALTPTQHLDYAHPHNRTQEINVQYQHLLLLSKADRIRENLQQDEIEHIYAFQDFLYVLHVGFSDDEVIDISDMDFCSVVHAINLHYAHVS